MKKKESINSKGSIQSNKVLIKPKTDVKKPNAFDKKKDVGELKIEGNKVKTIASNQELPKKTNNVKKEEVAQKMSKSDVKGQEILYEDFSSDDLNDSFEEIEVQSKKQTVCDTLDDMDLFNDVLNQVNEFDCKVGMNPKEDKTALSKIEILELERSLPEEETIFTEEMLLIDDKSLKVMNNKRESCANTLRDLITTESKIEETKTRMNNYLGADKAKTIYESIRKEIWEEDNIDFIHERSCKTLDIDKEEMTQLTNLIISERIIEESNKRQITKMHILEKEQFNWKI